MNNGWRFIDGPLTATAKPPHTPPPPQLGPLGGPFPDHLTQQPALLPALQLPTEITLPHGAQKLADEGPLFVVVFDVDETLLQSHKRGTLLNPQTPPVLDSLLRESQRYDTRLHSMVILTNGSGTSGKFLRAGLPPVQHYFKMLFELSFAKRTSPDFYQKDLAQLRDEIVAAEGTPHLARRLVMVLLDDRGNTFELYNKCHKEHDGVISVQVDAFNPYQAEKNMPTGFGLANFHAVFMQFLHTPGLSAMSIRHATEALALQLLSVTPSAQGYHPLVNCPFETQRIRLSSPDVQRDVIYPILVTDARWMLEFLKSRVKALRRGNKTKGSSAGSSEANLGIAAKEMAAVFGSVAQYTTLLFVRCNEWQYEYISDDAGKPKRKFDCVSLKWYLYQGFLAMNIAPPPLLFSSDELHSYKSRRRTFEFFPLLKQLNHLPVHRTLTIVFDGPTMSDAPFTMATHKSPVGFFKLDMEGVGKWRCLPYVAYHHENEHQFILMKGTGEMLEYLQVLMDRMGILLKRVTTPEEISSDRQQPFASKENVGVSFLSVTGGKLKRSRSEETAPSHDEDGTDEDEEDDEDGEDLSPPALRGTAQPQNIDNTLSRLAAIKPRVFAAPAIAPHPPAAFTQPPTSFGALPAKKLRRPRSGSCSSHVSSADVASPLLTPVQTGGSVKARMQRFEFMANQIFYRRLYTVHTSCPNSIPVTSSLYYYLVKFN